MLDKTIPYFNILLMRKQGTNLTTVPLPEGFHFDYFNAGDEKAWADIEASVLEFPNNKDAMEYFEKEYLKYTKELFKRCIFITTEQGEKIGTATAWWSTKEDLKVPSIHWVSIKPKFQKLGLGKSLVSEIIKISIERDGDYDSFIHTQTWSYPAIGIYLKAGYKIMTKGTFSHFQNDFNKALPYLKDKMKNRFLFERDTTALS